MIEIATVFVVGAGASAGYGFPLGPALVHDLIRAVGDTNSDRRRQLRIAEFRDGDLDEFSEKLRRSDSESIDTFLEGNHAEYARIGRAAIALTILQAEQLCKHHDLFLSKPHSEAGSLAIDHDACHWLYHVWNLMRAGATAQTFGHNKVSFLVFNYDRTIEHYFDTVLANAFNLSGPEATSLRKESVRILHLHGAIPESQAFGAYHPQFAGERVNAIGQGILVIHDVGAQSDPEVFSKTHETFEAARNELRKASVICFLGFGYHQLNIERLSIRELDGHGKTFYCSAYRLGMARRLVAEFLMAQQVHWGHAEAKSARFLSEHVPLR